jgi:hypothetical protein
MTATSPPRIAPPTVTPIHQRWITSLTDIVTVTAWRDEAIELNPNSIPTTSDSAWVWFLPSLGPLSLAMAHRFSHYAATGPSTWMVEDIAKTFGIGESIARVCQPIDRLEKFGIIQRTGRTVAVRLWLPPLTQRQIARLPDYLAAVYPG